MHRRSGRLSVAPFCEEGSFEVLAVQIDFVLACDAFWPRILRFRRVGNSRKMVRSSTNQSRVLTDA
jgi:hypothetical protein